MMNPSQQRISNNHFFGTLTWVWLIFAISTVCFVLIAFSINSGSQMEKWDVLSSNWIHARTTAPMIRTARVITFLGSGYFLIPGFILISCYFALKRYYFWLILSCLITLGGVVGTNALKTLFHRARPCFEDPILLLATYSFPSGHVMGSTLFYGAILYLALSASLSFRFKIFSMFWVSLLLLSIALTRIYLGVHYFSDTLAGFAAGISWLTFSIGTLRVCTSRLACRV